MNYTYHLVLKNHNEIYTIFNKNTLNFFIILVISIVIVYFFFFCFKNISKYTKKPYPFDKIDHITDESSNLLCPICLDNLSDNLVKFKVCPHILHKKCSNKFLLHYMNKCPICRKNIYN